MSAEATPECDSNPDEREGRDSSRYPALHNLTPAQARAVEALLAGASHSRAADDAGVHRVTVTRWVNHHPASITALNVGKADHANEMKARAHGLTRMALDVVEGALNAGDVRAALQWLRLHPPREVAPDAATTPEGVVETVRAAMPSPLDVVLTAHEMSTEDAESAIVAHVA